MGRFARRLFPQDEKQRQRSEGGREDEEPPREDGAGDTSGTSRVLRLLRHEAR